MLWAARVVKIPLVEYRRSESELFVVVLKYFSLAWWMQQARAHAMQWGRRVSSMKIPLVLLSRSAGHEGPSLNAWCGTENHILRPLFLSC